MPSSMLIWGCAEFTMAFRISCPSCKAANSVDEDQRGKKIRCQDCDQPMMVPGRKDEDEAVVELKGKTAPRRNSRELEEDEPAPAKPKKSRAGVIAAVVMMFLGALFVLGTATVILVVVLYYKLGN